jgi:hypothetical protein
MQIQPRVIGFGQHTLKNESVSIIISMSFARKHPILFAAGAIALAWLLAWSGSVIFRHSRMTAEKVKQYQASLDLTHLSTAERLKALKALAEKLNALSPEERQLWRLDLDWFRQLTDQEKAYFLDAFLPGEMQMALRMFEQWPKDQQQREIDRAFEELRKNAANPQGRLGGLNGTNPPLFTPDMEKQIRTTGLSTLYGQGSAGTKAQLAPLLMEVQRQFESGQLNLNRF